MDMECQPSVTPRLPPNSTVGTNNDFKSTSWHEPREEVLFTDLQEISVDLYLMTPIKFVCFGLEKSLGK
jgi:hypothetical protein